MVSVLIQIALRAAGALLEAAGSVSDFVQDVRGGPSARRASAAVARPLRLPYGAAPVGAAIACVDQSEHAASREPHAYDGFPGPVLVLNAMSLLGRECLSRLTLTHWSVIAGVRSLHDAATLTTAYGTQLHPMGLDLDDPQSVELTLEEVARVAGDARLAIVHVGDPNPVTPLESVFPDAPGAGQRDSGRAQEALAALLDRADRLVIVSPERARRVPDATLAGALSILSARRAATGENEIDLAWVHSAGSRCAPAGISEQIEAALRCHEVRLPFGG